MSIATALNLLLEEYSEAKKHALKRHPLADFIRNDIPSLLEEVIGPNDQYLVQGSPGQGDWAGIPWFAVFDRLITETAQDGFYIVYLVKEDCSGVYVSINQGATTIRDAYGADAKGVLNARAADFLARLGKVPSTYVTGQIDLATKNPSGLGSYYECGNIIGKYYAKGAIPTDNLLEDDLREFLEYFRRLASKDLLPLENSSVEDDEMGLDFEDLTTLKQHKRIDRNRKLAQEAKHIHGFKCQACGFDFEATYGEIGKGFIEAHHLTPLSELKGQKVKLNPKTDFSVLCSNCHRIIHKSPFVSEVKEFRAHYIKGTSS